MESVDRQPGINHVVVVVNVVFPDLLWIVGDEAISIDPNLLWRDGNYSMAELFFFAGRWDGLKGLNGSDVPDDQLIGGVNCVYKGSALNYVKCDNRCTVAAQAA